MHSYLKKGCPVREDLFDRSCYNIEEIPHFKVDSRWILAPESVQKELANFERSCRIKENLFCDRLCRIGDFCDIGNGMVSGLDSAFKIDPDKELTESEKKSVMKVLKAKDLESFSYVSTSSYIYYG